MSGKELRLKKFFGGKKNLVISAVDHVLEYGDQEGLQDSRQAIDNCRGTDALLLSNHMLKRNWDLFAYKSSPKPVVRINWTSSFYYPLDYREGHTAIITEVEEAVASGAEAVICSLFLEEQDNQEMERDNVKSFSEVVRQKEKLGIPLIGECYVVEHKDITSKALHNKVKRVSRVMAELGADLVKTFFTGDDFDQIVANTPVPVFTIGAEKLSTDLEVLEKADQSIKKGARGIIFGRNIFMSKRPGVLIKALNDVINRGLRPTEAQSKYGL
jgi:DhnA family fructose-bisphosphate aldolase class Ia